MRHIKYENNNIQAIVDSGAASTFISNKFMKKFQIAGTLTKETRKLVSANCQSFVVEWSIKLEFSIGSYKFTQECSVINRLSTDMLLGKKLGTLDK